MRNQSLFIVCGGKIFSCIKIKFLTDSPSKLCNILTIPPHYQLIGSQVFCPPSPPPYSLTTTDPTEIIWSPKIQETETRFFSPTSLKTGEKTEINLFFTNFVFHLRDEHFLTNVNNLSAHRKLSKRISNKYVSKLSNLKRKMWKAFAKRLKIRWN